MLAAAALMSAAAFFSVASFVSFRSCRKTTFNVASDSDSKTHECCRCNSGYQDRKKLGEANKSSGSCGRQSADGVDFDCSNHVGTINIVDNARAADWAEDLAHATVVLFLCVPHVFFLDHSIVRVKRVVAVDHDLSPM